MTPFNILIVGNKPKLEIQNEGETRGISAAYLSARDAATKPSLKRKCSGKNVIIVEAPVRPECMEDVFGALGRLREEAKRPVIYVSQDGQWKEFEKSLMRSGIQFVEGRYDFSRIFSHHRKDQEGRSIKELLTARRFAFKRPVKIKAALEICGGQNPTGILRFGEQEMPLSSWPSKLLPVLQGGDFIGQKYLWEQASTPKDRERETTYTDRPLAEIRKLNKEFEKRGIPQIDQIWGLAYVWPVKAAVIPSTPAPG